MTINVNGENIHNITILIQHGWNRLSVSDAGSYFLEIHNSGWNYIGDQTDESAREIFASHDK